MRTLVLAVLVIGCGDDAPVTADAGPDAQVLPGDGEYWPCWSWEPVSETVSRCSPKCSNRTLLGRIVWGEQNTCEYLPGLSCPVEMMTGDVDRPGTGCCVYVPDDPERVQFAPCL